MTKILYNSIAVFNIVNDIGVIKLISSDIDFPSAIDFESLGRTSKQLGGISLYPGEIVHPFTYSAINVLTIGIPAFQAFSVTTAFVIFIAAGDYEQTKKGDAHKKKMS